MKPWPHQEHGVSEAILAVEGRQQAVCVTSPTGGGKTFMQIMLLKEAVRRRWSSVLYTDRRMLLQQTADKMSEHGIDFGVRAAGHRPALLRDIQISSIQTECSRINSGTWRLHDGRLVIVDEAHKIKDGKGADILRMHKAAGGTLVGFTATPIDMGGLYDGLIVAGTNSQMRACKAHVICKTYAPDEPDTMHIKRTRAGEFREADVVKAIMVQSIFGRVMDHWKRLNPYAMPTLLFAPGVKESRWFVDQFEKEGVHAAHIDGKEIYVDGETYPSTQEVREQIMDDSKSGHIKVVCNRFVLREGIDMPWLYHGIMATMFGSLTSYLQAGGRLLRYYPGLDHVVLQDHGGNWWKHGSLNVDRTWDLRRSEKDFRLEREERIREKSEPEPIVCPSCGMTRRGGGECPGCGHRHEKSKRIVVQVDGSLMETADPFYAPKKEATHYSDTEKLWQKCYWRCFHTNRTFGQAMGLFIEENGYRPPKDLPFMPKSKSDWKRRVKMVKRADLHMKETV